MIHQTAVIGSGAKIGANVEIGPHSVIGGAVTIADDCVIGANVVIEGEVSIGRSNRIGHGAIIGGEPQDVGFSPTTRSRVEIGERNIIREQSTIHRGTTADSATKIGDENFLMVNAHVGHNCVIGNKVIIAITRRLRLRQRYSAFRYCGRAQLCFWVEYDWTSSRRVFQGGAR